MRLRACVYVLYASFVHVCSHSFTTHIRCRITFSSTIARRVTTSRQHQVLEVHELFQNLATLVDLQQESLDVISNRISQAKNYTEKAEREVGHCCFFSLFLSCL